MALSRAFRVGGVLVFWAASMGFAGCGARTGLEWDRDGGERTTQGSAGEDGGSGGGGGGGQGGGGGMTCASSVALENASAADAGIACMAGDQLLDCDVASTGTHSFENYCVTTDPSCSPVENPTCVAQCNAGEFGILCQDLTVPSVSGCRVLWPQPASGPSGFAFCCSCG